MPSDDAPAADAEREGGLALAAGHEPEHLLRGARDQREHHDRQARTRRRSPLCGWPSTSRPKTKTPMIDRRQAVHQVERELDRRRRAARGANSVRKSAISTPSGSGDRRGDSDEDRRADDRRRDPAAGLAEERRVLREEAPGQLARAAAGDRADDDPEHGERGQRCGCRRRLGQPVHDPAAPARASPRSVEGGLDRGHAGPARWARSGGRSAARAGSSGARSRAGSRRGRRATTICSFEIAPWNSPAIRLASVSPVVNSDVWMPLSGADDLGHRDRLAERPPEAEDDGRGDPGTRRGQDDAAHHLPAGRAERQRALLELAAGRSGRGRGRCWRRSGRP